MAAFVFKLRLPNMPLRCHGRKNLNISMENDDKGCDDFSCAHDTVPSSLASAGAEPRHRIPTSSPSYSTAGCATRTTTAPGRAPPLCFPRRPDAPNPIVHDLVVPLPPPHRRPRLSNAVGVEFLISSCGRIKEEE